MKNRKFEIDEFAKSLAELESKYSVKVISSNGFTCATIIDVLTNHDYAYLTQTGKVVEQ